MVVTWCQVSRNDGVPPSFCLGVLDCGYWNCKMRGPVLCLMNAVVLQTFPTSQGDGQLEPIVRYAQDTDLHVARAAQQQVRTRERLPGHSGGRVGIGRLVDGHACATSLCS